MINIDFNNINDEIVYKAFHVERKEAEALIDSYLELFELIGRDAMLELFTHFHGDKIDCPMRLYRAEFIPAGNEPSGCLQTFGDCREGQIPRCSVALQV